MTSTDNADRIAEARKIVAEHAWALGFDVDDPAGLFAIEEVPTAGEACGRLAQAKGVWSCKAWVYFEALCEADAERDAGVDDVAENIIILCEHHLANARPRKGSIAPDDLAALIADRR